MNIIIPMAGMGKRMRPHSITIPKPLIPVAGKPIVQHLVEDIAELLDEKIEEIGFIIGRFGDETEAQLLEIAKSVGAKGKIYYQDEALGTAHAIYCANESLKGRVVVAFADTLFRANFKLNKEADSVIFAKQVDDPSQFGVITQNADGSISGFHEKPEEFISDLAIIGIYYFKSGEQISSELAYLIDNDIKDKGEYQITSALINMLNKGKLIEAGSVNDWMDCGNKDATVETNAKVLDYKKDQLNKQPDQLTLINSTILQPSFIGENVTLKNSIVGPHASIGENSIIVNSLIKNSIIQSNTKITNKVMDNSMVGNSVTLDGQPDVLSIGDFTTTN